MGGIYTPREEVPRVYQEGYLASQGVPGGYLASQGVLEAYLAPLGVLEAYLALWVS